MRVARGIYAKAADMLGKGEDEIFDSVVSAISRHHKISIQVNSKTALEKLKHSSSYKKTGFRPCSSEFIWAGGPKKFMVNGSQIAIKRVSHRKVAMCNTNVGLAITSIWGLDKGKMVREKIKSIMDELSEPERLELMSNKKSLPAWAANLIFEKKNTLLNESVTIPNQDDLEKKWTPSNVEGRWCGFGPYYAMFPVDFARKVISQYCPYAGAVLDPFCGRGTVPFVAMATGRKASACDINPVAWIYAKVKTDPHPNPIDVLARAKEVFENIHNRDHIPENEFQEIAWDPDVLAYLNAARRILNWRDSSIDRTLMGTLLIHLHAKLGDGFSNQMRQSKSMAPAYSVRWWKERNMQPPKIDMLELIKKKLDWRYQKGILLPKQETPIIMLQDAREAIPRISTSFEADLVFTSPPYCGVTNYRYDNWIRLWLLGEGPALPEGNAKQRYINKADYKDLLHETFLACSKVTKENSVIYVRTDARQFTLETTKEALRSAWPENEMFYIHDEFKKATQTALYGDKSKKPGEVDLLLLPKNSNHVHKMKKEPLRLK